MLMVQYKESDYFKDWMTDGENYISKACSVPIHAVETRAEVTIKSINDTGTYLFAEGLPMVSIDTLTNESIESVRNEYPELFI